MGIVFVAWWNQPPFQPYFPPYEYDKSLSENIALFSVTVNHKDGCMDRAGKIIIDPEYDEILCSSDNLIPYKSAGKWGYLNQAGQVILEPQFSLARHGYSNNFSSGLAVVCQNAKCGYIDESGQYAIPPIYDFAGHFYEGFADVMIGSRSFLGWQYKSPINAVINLQGNVVFGEPDVVPHGRFSDRLACVYIQGKPAFADANGAISFITGDLQANEFHEGLAVFGTRDLYRFGYIDKLGQVVIPQQFKQAGEFSEGLATVMFENGKYGYIDKTGRTIIEPRFDIAGTFYEGRAVVGIGYLNGYIDQSGEIVIPVQFGSAERFKDGLARVSFNDQNPPYENKRYGYIDKVGRFVWEPTF